MPVTVESEGDGVYRVEASGTLLKSEMDELQAAAAQVIAHVGKVRVLFVLERFKGWERGADWGDMRFFETVGQKIERIAVVGEEKWRDPARMFLLADMRDAPVRFFLSGEIDQARGWLSL